MPDDDTGTEDTSSEEKEEKKPAEKMITQAQASRIMKVEKEEGRVMGRKGLLEELGITDEAEIKALLQEKQERDDKDKSESQKERDAARREKEAATAERAAAKKERFEARVEREFLRQKGKVERSEKAVRLVDVDEDSDTEAVKVAVEEFRNDYPEFFEVVEKKDGEEEGESGEQEQKQETKGMPPSRPKVTRKTRTDGKSSSDLGKERLRERHPDKVKQESS
jgi:hypothetical protein